jgi:hypothetical protein
MAFPGSPMQASLDLPLPLVTLASALSAVARPSPPFPGILSGFGSKRKYGFDLVSLLSVLPFFASGFPFFMATVLLFLWGCSREDVDWRRPL